MAVGLGAEHSWVASLPAFQTQIQKGAFPSARSEDEMLNMVVHAGKRIHMIQLVLPCGANCHLTMLACCMDRRLLG